MKEMLSNKIIKGLPEAEFARLMPLLEHVSLVAGERLGEGGESAEFLYFPENSIISSHADMRDGKSAEVAMIGREGVVGLPALFDSLPAAHSLNVSVAGSAFRLRNLDFEPELEHLEVLRQSLLAYIGEYVTQVSQRLACAILHRLEQRFAVWLLMLSDRLDTDTIEINHERIAQHLGVRRAGVTLVIGNLQERGAIRYTRGRLRLVSRQALQSIACECYLTLACTR
jgi:CRP-like cAMP-binding protein